MDSLVSWSRAEPEGDLITALAANSGEIDKVLSEDYPDLWPVSRQLACNSCPHYSHGKGGGGATTPIGEKIGFAYHDLFLAERSVPFRRTIMLLALLSKDRMRRGGYYWKDLHWMTGRKSRANTTRIIKELQHLGALKCRKRSGRAPRYQFSGFDSTKAVETIVGKMTTSEATGLLRTSLGEISSRPASRKGRRSGKALSVGWCLGVGPEPPEQLIGFFEVLAQISTSAYQAAFGDDEDARRMHRHLVLRLAEELSREVGPSNSEVQSYLTRLHREDQDFLLLAPLSALCASAGVFPKWRVSADYLSTLNHLDSPRCSINRTTPESPTML